MIHYRERVKWHALLIISIELFVTLILVFEKSKMCNSVNSLKINLTVNVPSSFKKSLNNNDAFVSFSILNIAFHIEVYMCRNVILTDKFDKYFFSRKQAINHHSKSEFRFIMAAEILLNHMSIDALQSQNNVLTFGYSSERYYLKDDTLVEIELDPQLMIWLSQRGDHLCKYELMMDDDERQ